MKRVYKTGFFLLGSLSLFLLGSSCAKKQECCSLTDDSSTIEYCEDDEEFENDAEWETYKIAVKSDGGVCEEKKIK